MSTLLGYLQQYECVGDDDDDEGQGVHRHDVKQIVGEFVCRRGEEVERHTLRVVLVYRVVLHVEDDALKTQKNAYYRRFFRLAVEYHLPVCIYIYIYIYIHNM